MIEKIKQNIVIVSFFTGIVVLGLAIIGGYAIKEIYERIDNVEKAAAVNNQNVKIIVDFINSRIAPPK